MKIRKHRGGYADSMDTEKEIEPTFAAVVEFVNNSGMHSLTNERITPEMIKIRPYNDFGLDKRNGWDTHIVCVEAKTEGIWDGVFGFTDGMPVE